MLGKFFFLFMLSHKLIYKSDFFLLNLSLEWTRSEIGRSGDQLTLLANHWKELRDEVLKAWTQNQDSFKVYYFCFLLF